METTIKVERSIIGVVGERVEGREKQCKVGHASTTEGPSREAAAAAAAAAHSLSFFRKDDPTES